jgi:hypothetical protein
MEDSMRMNRIYKLRDAAVSSLFLGLLVCVGIVLSSGATAARAQSTSSGTVTGQVTDPQNAVVPKADVTLFDVATNTPRKTQTDDAGRYTFFNIPPGVYDISVSRTGFKSAKVDGQKIAVGVVRSH